MKLIVMVDCGGGVAFNYRRQSRDAYLNQYLLDYVGDAKLWMNAYTYKLFEEFGSTQIVVDEAFLSKMDSEDYGICEKMSLEDYEGEIDTLIVCNWNREYLHDVKLGLEKENYQVCELCEIVGKSHEKITIEQWKRR